MKKIILIFVCISIAVFFLFIGCEKKKALEPAREEVITELPQEEGAVQEREPEREMDPGKEPVREREPEKELERELEPEKEPIRVTKMEKEPVGEPQPEALEPESHTTGVVTYASGEVFIDRGARWSALDVDDAVSQKNRIKTETDSFCEIQFTDFGIIRIQESTEVAIADLFLTEDQNRVKVRLDGGKLLCKVSKLSKGEEFQVRTSTALAGVRGTEFMVDARKEDNSVLFAVKEGSVSVLPVAVADKIEEIRDNLKTEAAKDTLSEISVPEIIVTEDRELFIQQEEVQKVAEQFEPVSKIIEEKVKRIDQKVMVFEEKERKIETKGRAARDREVRELEEIKADIVELQNEVISVTGEKTESVKDTLKAPVAVSKPSVNALTEIEKMETKDFVIAVLLEPKEEAREKKPAYTKLSIRVVPADAIIFVDGDEAGKGRFSGLYLPNTELTIRVEREGYIPEEKKISVSEEDIQSITIELKDSPLAWKLKAGDAPLVRKIVGADRRIVVADAVGRLICIDSQGKFLWSYESGNKPNNNSMPVVMGDTVLFSGTRELVALNIATGKEIKRIPIGKGDYSSHIFGRRVAGFNGSVVYPSNNSLLLLDLKSLQETKRISLPEIANSSPAVYGNHILIAGQKGTLLTIDPVSGEVKGQVKSNALQSVCIAPSIVDKGAVFAGRDGTTVFIDLLKNERKWEKKLNLGGGSGIFQDIAASERGVYPYTGTQFYALDSERGTQLFGPVRSTCPPLLQEGTLYFGDREGRLVIMDALTGNIQKRFPLDSTITLEPLALEGDVLVGTKTGTLYRLRPKFM